MPTLIEATANATERCQRLTLVWNAARNTAVSPQLSRLAHWQLRGVTAEPREASALSVARYFTRLPPGQVVEIEHRIEPAAQTTPRYSCSLSLLGDTDASRADIDAMTQAFASLAPDLWFERDSSAVDLPDWPLIANVRPSTARLWHEFVPPAGAWASSSRQSEAPYPTRWPSATLAEPLSDHGSSQFGLRIVQCIRSFELNEEAQTTLHATMRQIQAGVLRCYGKESPLSPFSADAALRQALIALMQQWLITPRGWCFDMRIHAQQPMHPTAIERIAQSVFGSTPFDVSAPGTADSPPSFSRASLPVQGLPTIWPDSSHARKLGTTVYYAPPEASLATNGALIGSTAAGPASVPVYLDHDARTRHVLMCGGSGSGKTTGMFTMMVPEIAASVPHCSVIYETPHDPDAEKLLAHVPEHRMDDVLMLDLSDSSHTHCLNPLEGMRTDPVRAHRIASQFCDIVDSMFETQISAGPMIRSNFKHLVLLAGLRQDRNGTLLDMVRAIEDKKFLNWLIAHCPDPALAGYWKRFLATSGDNGYDNWLPYMQARIAPFTSNPKLKRLLCRPNSTINLRQAMDEPKILICNLSKSALQDIECRTVGALLLMMIHEAALSRGNQDPAQYVPCHLYVDEFQSFASDSVGRMFTELRKFSVGICASLQQTGQLANRWGRESILDGVLTNTASKLLFRLGTPDIGPLGPYFSPTVSSTEIARLPDFHAVATMPHRGRAGAPFVMRVTPPEVPVGAPGADAVRKHARLKCDTVEHANEELVRLFDLSPAALG